MIDTHVKKKSQIENVKSCKMIGFLEHFNLLFWIVTELVDHTISMPLKDLTKSNTALF